MSKLYNFIVIWSIIIFLLNIVRFIIIFHSFSIVSGNVFSLSTVTLLSTNLFLLVFFSNFWFISPHHVSILMDVTYGWSRESQNIGRWNSAAFGFIQKFYLIHRATKKLVFFVFVISAEQNFCDSQLTKLCSFGLTLSISFANHHH